MKDRLRRRSFLQATAALGVGLEAAGAAGWRSLATAQAGMRVGPEAVRLRPEIEPVVRWIEETPRDRIVETALDHLQAGLSYRDLMASLFLAGIRNIRPRPVGFKFHAVLVVHSAHMLGQTAQVDDRLLPLLWGLDYFKSSQQKDVEEGDWALGPIDEARVPGAEQAAGALGTALERWDAEAADTAVAGVCRSEGAGQIMEVFWRCAVRDQRNIGHKPIFAMQCDRTLRTIGWEHAEPVLRSLAYGLLDREGDSEPSPIGPYHSNVENAVRIRPGWAVGTPDPGATRSLLEVLRSESPEGASASVVERLNAGVAPGSLWDAVLLAANELLVNRPGILPLHAATAANALHYIFHTSGDLTTRKLALLQAAGWIPLYRQSGGAGSKAVRLDAMEPARDPAGEGEPLETAFHALTNNRKAAARDVAAFIERGGEPEEVFAVARRMIFTRASDAHQYKYAAALWEECRLATDPAWRAPLAAAITAYAPGPDTPEHPLMQRIHEASARILGTATRG
jgi:hypothetical protein